MPIYHPEPGDPAAEQVHRRTYQSFACGLLHFGPIALYCSKLVLEEDLERLKAERFDVRRFDAARWATKEAAHADLMATLDFPDYYGKNLDALNDCLGDLDIADDGGMAVVLDDYDEFARRKPDFATGVLDIFACGSRLLQIFGKTLLVLVHSKDPDINFGPLGAVTAWWNSKEFLRSERGKE